MTAPITRRAFLQVLGVVTLPTARFAQPQQTVLPAGFSGGFLSGFAPRSVRTSKKRNPGGP